MDEILRRLGQRIRDIRVDRGFSSQEALADYLKMHRTFIGHLETGRKDFRVTTLIRVSEALGVSLADLFAGVEGSTQPKRVAKNAALTQDYAVAREVAVLERSVQRLKTLTGERPAKRRT